MDYPQKLTTLGTQDTRRRQAKQKHNTLCVEHHYAKTKTNNVRKSRTLLQENGGKDKPNIVLCGNRNGKHNTELGA